jgi:hypothetical protein
LMSGTIPSQSGAKKNSSSKAASIRRKRRLLAWNLFAVLATPTVAPSVFGASNEELGYLQVALIPQESSTSPLPLSDANNTNSVADDFLGDTPLAVTSEPDAQSDAAALLQQSVAPSPPATVGPGANAPSRLDPPPFNLSSTNSSLSSLGATSAALSASPAMMGDFFGGSFIFDSGFPIGAALAGGDRRFKIAENVSPMPRDRVYFNYNHFHNALTNEFGDVYSLDRFAFGMERTFSDDLFSWEVRLPFASALNSTFDASNPIPQNTELGNAGLGLKALLLTTDTLLVSAGTTLTLPTGDDYVRRSNGVTDYTIKNDASHLAPYLGFLATPDRNWFFQGFMQMDFDLRGNDVVFGSGFQCLWICLLVAGWLDEGLAKDKWPGLRCCRNCTTP